MDERKPLSPQKKAAMEREARQHEELSLEHARKAQAIRRQISRASNKKAPSHD